MPDEELASIVAEMQLRERAVRAIIKRQYTGKPGDRWHVESSDRGSGFPYYNGVKAVARLYGTDDGTAFKVCVYSYKGELLTEVVRKGLDAAFSIGVRLADEGLESAGNVNY